jgi:predicted DsbA family dithiol-disulfide isomerase
VQWAYFPLHPDTPTEGLLLKDLFAGRGLDLNAMHARMKALMDGEALHYNRRTHTYNSRLAQELAKWADTKPGFDKIHKALYEAYFADGRNLADKEVLLDIAQSAGLPVEEAQSILDNRIFKDAVDSDWQKARQYGITGVPTFVVKGSKLVGAQPYEVLAQHLRAAGVQER